MARNPDSAREVVTSVRQVSLALERWRADFAHRWGLAGNDSVVMSHLVAAGGAMRPRDLARQMSVSTGSMTAMLDRLERTAFVRRTPNPDDRRSVRVELTEAGAGALRETQEQLSDRIAAAFGDDVRAELAAALTRLADLISDTSEAVDATPTA